VISAFLTAVVVNFILGYSSELAFSGALLFGAILSATDPVAVVSILKELGAPPSLSTLIEGESLLNDGTGIVLFEVILEIALGK